MPFLYLGNRKTLKSKGFPISPSSFEYAQMDYYIYLNEFFQIIDIEDSIYPTMFRKNIRNRKAVTNYHPDAKTITIPSNTQFRVHACTELYNKGVPLKYIQKFMTHLSSEMEGYYVRPTEQNPQENMNFSLDTLQKIVTGETKPLGGKSSLMDKINEFIEKNNYNVETDLDAICAKLAKKIPIRQKSGGVCIQSSLLRDCSKDAETNEFYCAYGVCVNIFHFYYMANLSYRQTKELIKTIQINKEGGFLRQAQKELNMLNTIINKKLVPELEELKNMINKKGTSSILIEYPDLDYIVNNLDNIYKEVELWKEMK